MLLTAASAYVMNSAQMGAGLRAGFFGRVKAHAKGHGGQTNPGDNVTHAKQAHEKVMRTFGKMNPFGKMKKRSGGTHEGEEEEAQPAQGRSLFAEVSGMVTPSDASKPSPATTLAIIFAFIIFAFYYFGLVTFWSRANPNAPLALRILAYLGLLLFGDLYTLYVIFRFSYFGITRREDAGYAALHKPTFYFVKGGSKSAPRV